MSVLLVLLFSVLVLVLLFLTVLVLVLLVLLILILSVLVLVLLVLILLILVLLIIVFHDFFILSKRIAPFEIIIIALRMKNTYHKNLIPPKSHNFVSKIFIGSNPFLLRKEAISAWLG